MSKPSPPQPWYVTAFGPEYLRLYASRSREQAARQAEQIRELASLTPRDRILDACCGAGRHSLALSGMGLQVAGFDLSLALLEKGRADAAIEGLPFLAVQADMRRPPYAGAFDAVLSLFTSFGYFDEAGNAEALDALVGCLRPGGRLLMDLPNRAWLEANLVPRSVEERDGVTITAERRLTGLRVEKTTHVETAHGSATYEESVRLHTREELAAMLARRGVEVTAAWGDFDGRPFNNEAQRMILLTAPLGPFTASGGHSRWS